MKSGSNRRILVLDADMVPALTIARSLSRRGCEVTVASHTSRPLSSFSNAVRACLQYPDPLSATEAFIEWLLAHLRTVSYELVIPVTERTLLAISNRRAQFSHQKIAMPDAHSLEIALDKSQTLALADQLGVPRPFGVSLDSLDDLAALKDRLRYPLVLKPARSIGSAHGEASQLQVSYAFDELELKSGCAHALRFGPVLLQEYFPGLGVGIELIAKQGEILYSFQHLRLHEVPLTGGGSSLRKSEPVMPPLLEASAKLIGALDWTGVAMVEFKLNPQTLEFCLMEINGRFWGSLPLAVAAGADFPSMLLDLELGLNVKAHAAYRNNMYCRLLSRDMYWYEAILRGDADSRIARIPNKTAVIRELGLFFNFRHRFDVQSLRDPLPGFVDVGRVLQTYVTRVQVLLEERRFNAAQRKAWRIGEVAAGVSRAKSMLFLCYGNINRSALADAMIRGYAEDSGIVVASAGFHEHAGRPADPIMVEVAGTFGLQMQNLRSSRVSPEMLRDSDMIFVMEKSHYDKVVALDATTSGKVYLLGAHTNNRGWPVEISDPYGRARDYYYACYERIAEAVDNLKALIAMRSSD
jgi:protein-tyrosine-phosphatase/predicted ATP-grasp superfamily ATP-dependent carboligase